MIDRKYTGGSMSEHPLPASKKIIHSAKVASYFCRREEISIAKEGFAIDTPAVRAREREMVYRALNDRCQYGMRAALEPIPMEAVLRTHTF